MRDVNPVVENVDPVGGVDPIGGVDPVGGVDPIPMRVRS